MEKKYISVDIEASGPIPGEYSMLSLGACIVGETSVQFYRELKPISTNYVKAAMEKGCLGLRCLIQEKSLIYSPKSKQFRPEKVLEVLSQKGEDPEAVMEEYTAWVRKNTQGFKAIEAAAPSSFDIMFTRWYIHKFIKKGPSGGSEDKDPFEGSEDINSYYRGKKDNPLANIKDLNMRGKEGLHHNALEDAIQQAREFERVLSSKKS